MVLGEVFFPKVGMASESLCIGSGGFRNQIYRFWRVLERSAGIGKVPFGDTTWVFFLWGFCRIHMLRIQLPQLLPYLWNHLELKAGWFPQPTLEHIWAEIPKAVAVGKFFVKSDLTYMGLKDFLLGIRMWANQHEVLQLFDTFCDKSTFHPGISDTTNPLLFWRSSLWPGMVWHRDALAWLAAVLTFRGGLELTQCAACVVTFGDVALLGSLVLGFQPTSFQLRGSKGSYHPHPASPQMHIMPYPYPIHIYNNGFLNQSLSSHIWM